MGYLDDYWNVLDGLFEFIIRLFEGVFNSFPSASIPLLIAIYSYIGACILSVIYVKTPESYRKQFVKLFLVVFLIFSTTFTFWRFGFINMIDPIWTFEGIAELIVNLFWIGFVVVLVVAFAIQFSGQIYWVRNLIHISLWALLILVTFITFPALNYDYTPTDSVLFLLLATGGLDLSFHLWSTKLQMNKKAELEAFF